MNISIDYKDFDSYSQYLSPKVLQKPFFFDRRVTQPSERINRLRAKMLSISVNNGFSSPTSCFDSPKQSI